MVAAIYRAVDELNKQVPKGVKVEKSPAEVLYGKSSQLESLDLVNFIMEVEDKIKEEFGISVVIADELAMSQENSPFLTLGTFTDYMTGLLAQNGIPTD